MKFLLMLSGIFVIALMWSEVDIHAKDPTYIGVKGCTKACHKKKKDGNQRTVWQESDHSQAFKTLGTDDAKKKAAELGVEGSPQKSEQCLICHTTGYGEDKSRFKKKFKVEDGVQCEACHGAGNNYRKKKVMRRILIERGVDRKGESATAQETGLVFPGDDECKTCHVAERTWNGKTFKNPSYEEFNFDEFFEKIEHRVPDKKREAVVAKGTKGGGNDEEEED